MVRYKTSIKGMINIVDISYYSPDKKYQVELFFAKKMLPVIKRTNTKREALVFARKFAKNI